MQGLSLNFRSETLFTLVDKIKSSIEGRMSWGDTFGLGLGVKSDKHLIVWTPKETSEGDILPGFDSEDGKLTLKMRPRPGAWVSWIDEAKVTAETQDDYDRVHRSIQELERNARQITEFADGVVSEITIQNLGKSLTLSELTQDVLKARLAIPSTIKTGAYILAQTEGMHAATVIVPEQTHIHRIHLNEDVLFDRMLTQDYDVLLVVLRTHIKQYPDLADLGYSLTLRTRLSDVSNNKDQEIPDAVEGFDAVQVLATAAVYDPLEPETLKLVPLTFNAPAEDIETAIAESSKKIEAYTVKANQQAHQLMAQFQQGVETRLRALVLGPGQRVHNKVWDDLVVRELRSTILAFVDFYAEYLTEHFEAAVAAAKTEALTQNIDSMIEFWQLQDNQQLTLNHLIQSSYKLANQVLDRAAGLFHDLVFEQDFIQTDFVRQIELLTFENNERLDEIYLPQWTRATVREKMAGFTLRSTLHATQIERLTTIWLELLELANFVSQHKQDFEKVIQPLVDLLLMVKTGQVQRRSQQAQQRSRTANFPGFEIPDDTFQRLLDHVKLYLPTIKQWLANLPPKSDAQQHYATLWTLVLDGKLRERLLAEVQPTCDINLSVPDQTKRLINLMLGSTLIIQAEKDRKLIERNLNRAIISKTGHELANITTGAMLAIHGDTLLAILYEELLGYHNTLAKRANRLTNAPQKGKKRKRGNSQNGGAVNVEAVEAEQQKVEELMTFLRPYRQEEVIATLATAGLDPRTSNLEEIRKQQVLSFDVSDLPAIGETWLDGSKSLEDYPNLRVFLLQNQLPISTTGRLLMELRQHFSDELFNHVLGLIQEVKALQSTDYQGDLLDQFVAYISEKVWRWELTQITETELPLLLKEKVLASAICYEKEVDTLLEYVERYDELVSTKLASDSEMDSHRQYIEEQFQAIVETLLV
ncbi:hypothetical protein F4054_08100 [Candidatus Poribacteria bacterium]|nr:hypothetical protein [Candidatus Poribacteria bacterium]MYK22206.1 hypothetical protein [Candidatus Poribacteria bacterium]